MVNKRVHSNHQQSYSACHLVHQSIVQYGLARRALLHSAQRLGGDGQVTACQRVPIPSRSTVLAVRTKAVDCFDMLL